MYSIFFHLLWLSLLEIIFYFEYVGPLETKTYLNTIKRLVNNYDESTNDIIVNPYNTSDIIHLNDMEFKKNEASLNREDYNNELYHKAINYWLVFLGIVSIIYLFIFIFKYYLFKKRKKNIEETESMIEFRTIRNRSLTLDSDDLTDNTDNIQNIDKPFINLHDLKKNIIYKTVFYLLLGGSILGFEYLFFNYIIIKYKVLSDDEILFEIYKLIDPLIHKIFH